jgi:hypothetical protein
MVTNPRKVLDTTTPDQDHRVFLKIMSHAANIGGDFLFVR